MVDVFPETPMPSWSVMKGPRFATRIQQTVSGRTMALLDQPYPIWNFSLTWEKLRDNFDVRGPSVGGVGVTLKELRTILSFYLRQQGSFGTWLYNDPTDNYAFHQFLGFGDGTRTTFPLIRAIIPSPVGLPQDVGAAEPVDPVRFKPNTLAPFNVYVAGILQSVSSVSITSAGLTFSSGPPAAAALVSADFGYYFLCRFLGDSMDLENFAYRLWTLKELKFTSVLS